MGLLLHKLVNKRLIFTDRVAQYIQRDEYILLERYYGEVRGSSFSTPIRGGFIILSNYKRSN